MKAARGKTIDNRKFRVKSENLCIQSFRVEIIKNYHKHSAAKFLYENHFHSFSFRYFRFFDFRAKAREVLAAANGQTFTVKNLSPETQKIYAELFVSIAEVRRESLSEMIAGAVFETEAKAKNQTVEKLLDDVKAKVPAPSDAEIQAVYDVNRAALGGKTLAETRQQIVAFLRHEPEQKALQNFLASLKTKYRVVPGKDVNAANLAPADILATVGARKISAREFEEKIASPFMNLKSRFTTAFAPIWKTRF
jgi:hypothetical protein